MDKERKRDVYLAALAGLMHDVGKVAQRRQEKPPKHTDAGEQVLQSEALSHLIPHRWEDDVGDVVKYHHGGDDHKEIVRRVCVADWLAASEREKARQERSEAACTPLIPITAEATLVPSDRRPPVWGYPLSADGSVPFPQRYVTVSHRAYEKLWEQFEPPIRAFPGPVDSYGRMAGLMDLLAAHLSYVPSATPWEADADERTTPDVPLYNHLHLTAAIAVCLGGLSDDEVNALYQAGKNRQLGASKKGVARLVKVDFSGIQDFIYRITTPSTDRSFRHTAKRLRGRSLHLALLNQAVGDWLLQELDLPPTQLIYAGGGVLELLLPPDPPTAQRLQRAIEKIQAGLWDEFEGALGVVCADVLLEATDFAEMGQARERLEDVLAQRKMHKWEGIPDMFEAHEIYHTCAVCGLTQVSDENQVCAACRAHDDIGGELPYATALVISTNGTDGLPGARIEPPKPLTGTFALVDKSQITDALKAAPGALVRGLNKFPEDYMGGTPGRWTLANAAPLRDVLVRGDSSSTTNRVEVCDFEEIAALSRGVPLLGVLKADADRMGLMFSRGLHPNTFSRAVALSQTIVRFFGEYLNVLAQQVTRQWRASLTAEQRQTLDDRIRRLDRRDQEPPPPFNLDALESVFYILYAGGDDLFIVGPWDALIDLALELRRQYRAYTCENPLFGLSAGMVLVKPHFPVQQFARLVNEAEDKAKEAGRDRITLFGETVTWKEGEMLVNTGKEWAEWIADGKMPRGLLHDLPRLAVAQQDKMFTPALYYTLTRRLSHWGQDRQTQLGKMIFASLAHLEIPVSYASLVTRKE